jgi:uncharacterized protein YceK
MKNVIWILLALLLVAGCSSAAKAQTCVDGSCGSAAGYASRLNGSRIFRHDPSWGGAEVIYRSSGTATEAEARQWWMNSPPHRKLLVSGAIQDIACVGGVCVGRSVQAVRNNLTEPFMQGVRTGVQSVSHRTPLRRIRNHFTRCR